jgi:hypothetical protein
MDKARQATHIKIIYCQEIPSVIRIKRHKLVTIMGLLCFSVKHNNLSVCILNIKVVQNNKMHNKKVVGLKKTKNILVY